HAEQRQQQCDEETVHDKHLPREYREPLDLLFPSEIAPEKAVRHGQNEQQGAGDLQVQVKIHSGLANTKSRTNGVTRVLRRSVNPASAAARSHIRSEKKC